MRMKDKVITDGLLAVIEEYWGFKLPSQYREFILSADFNIVKSKMFYFKTKEDGSCVDEFFDFTRGFNHNILLQKQFMADRIPNNMLPIGDDIYGNLILLAVKGSDRGKVYFWDHELEADLAQGESPDYSNLTLIADSFSDFISGLSDVKDLVNVEDGE